MGSKGIGPGVQRMCISNPFSKNPTRINVPTLGVVCTIHYTSPSFSDLRTKRLFLYIRTNNQ